MSNENGDRSRFFSGVSLKLETLTNSAPDIFTPAVVSSILDQAFAEAIVAGNIPGFVRACEDGSVEFTPLFEPSALAQIRTELLGIFQPPGFVEVSEADVLNDTTINGVDLNNPDTSEVVARFGEITIRKDVFSAD